MKISALRQGLFKFVLSLAIYFVAVAGFAQGDRDKHEGKGDDDQQEGQQKGQGNQGQGNQGQGNQGQGQQNQPSVMWINHLDLLPGDPSVVTAFNAINSGLGGGLSGLIIMSTTTGDTANGGGNKVVEKGLEVPPGFLITGVRVCYELSSARTFIDDIRLAQVQDPPSTALVLLDDSTQRVNPGPICVDSATTTVDPSLGGVRLDLRVNFGDPTDRIVVRAVALHLVGKP